MNERLPFAPMHVSRYPATVAAALLDAMRRRVPLQVLGSRGERQRLKRLLAYGVLWSLICTSVEVPNIPDGSVVVGTVIPALIQVLTDYLAMGLCLALALFWATAGHGSWGRLTLGILVAAASGSALVAFYTSSLWLQVFGDVDALGIVERDKTLSLQLALLSYYFWLIMVYGGLAATLYALRRRIDQMTTALRSATLARERNEAAIVEARVSAMVERIEPNFLLEAMRAAREHYRTDASRGESIVNGCVVFLRTAMPQIRSRHSNLAAELDLADAFLNLRSLIAAEPHTWRIERDDAPAANREGREDEQIPLPPLVLLPILERLLSAMVAGVVSGPLLVRRSRIDDSACLDIEIVTRDEDVAPIEADFLEVINQRIYATGGPGAKIVVDRSRPSHLVYRLCCPIPSDAGARPFIPSSPPHETIRRSP